MRAQRPEVRAAAGRLVEAIDAAAEHKRARLALLADGNVRRHEPLSSSVLPPHAAWRRLRDMRRVVANQPAIANAVRSLPLYDQLELTLELLRQHDWPEFAEPDPLPPNVIRFKPRRR